MSTAMNSLVDDWRRAREALQSQLDRMNDDPIFPVATLSAGTSRGSPGTSRPHGEV